MALGVYTSANSSSERSQNGTFSAPVALSANGLHGDTLTQKLYVRNDDASKAYTSIVVSLTDNGDDIVDGSMETYGFSWRLYASEEEPIEAQWQTVAAGNSISLADLTGGDISTYLPFWLKVVVPEFSRVKTYQDVQITITANESAA